MAPARLLLVLVALTLAAAVAPPAQAATTLATGNQPSLVVDREGTTHVVWNQSRPGDTDLTHYCRIPRGSTACANGAAGRVFNADTVGSPSAETYDVWGPQVMVSPFGDVIVLTHRCCANYDGTTVQSPNVVWHSEDDGANFDSGRILGDVPPGYPAGSTPAVYDGADRRVVTAASRTGGLDVQGASIDVATPTTAKATLFNADAYDPSIVQRGRGAFTVAWSDLGGTVRIRTYDRPGQPLADLHAASSWAPAQTVANAELPRLTTGPSGTFLTYRSTAGATNQQWFVRRVTGTQAGPATPLTGAGAGQPRDLFQDAAGRLHALTVDGENALRYRTSLDGVGWSAPRQLTADNDFTIGRPRLATARGDAGFTGFAIWESQPGGLNNPPLLLEGIPDPDPSAPPGFPPITQPDVPGLPAPPGTPPPAGPQPPAACRVLQFGPVDVVADVCLRRSGTTLIATGGAMVNGLRMKLASGRGEIRFDPRQRRVWTTAPITMSIGDTTLFRGEIDWKLPAGNVVSLPDLDVGKIGGKLVGFPLTGKAGLRLRRGAAELPVHLGLPKVLGGVTGDVTLRADNLAGLRLRDLKVRVGSAFLGPIEVRDLAFDYDADEKTWGGGAKVILPPQPPGPSLEARIGFREGDLDHLRGELVFPGTGIPLDPLSVVYLNRINFGFVRTPLSFSGGIGLTAGPAVGGTGAVRVDGKLTLTFPDPPAPTVIRADGTVSLVEIPIGSAFFELRTNGYAGFGGKLEYKIAGFGATAAVDGWVTGKAFNVGAKAQICLGDLGCSGGEVVFSSVGFAGCAQTAIADFGAGYKWGDGFPDLMFTGCDVGPYRASAAQAGGRSVRFGSDLPSGFVGVRGSGAAPRVALVGPGGQRIEPPADGPLRTADAIAFHTPDGTTWFVLRKPAAGVWRVEELPGSAPVRQVVSADGLPDPSVRASVGRRGDRRVLRYRIAPLPGQRVRFAERGRYAAREIGIAKGSQGTLAFRPADGPGGRRRIVAIVESHGTPRDVLNVASYVAPAPRRPGAPKRLRVRRSGTNLIATWRPATGASRYLARVALPDGRRLLLRTTRNRRRIDVPGVGARDRVTVTVRGLRADGAPGRLATRVLAPRRARRG